MKDHVSTNLSLPPIGRAALQVLSELDADSATGTALRLLREELQRVAPGVWQRLALEQVPQLDSPEARSDAYADRMREALRKPPRARSQRPSKEAFRWVYHLPDTGGEAHCSHGNVLREASGTYHAPACGCLAAKVAYG